MLVKNTHPCVQHIIIRYVSDLQIVPMKTQLFRREAGASCADCTWELTLTFPLICRQIIPPLVSVGSSTDWCGLRNQSSSVRVSSPPFCCLDAMNSLNKNFTFHKHLFSINHLNKLLLLLSRITVIVNYYAIELQQTLQQIFWCHWSQSFHKRVCCIFNLKSGIDWELTCTLAH